MGNLLAYEASFDLGAVDDRGRSIEHLSQAIDEAMGFGDLIFKSPSFYDENTKCGEFFSFLVNSNFDHEVFKQRFPWITQSQFQALMSISFIMQVTTPLESKSIEELEAEFPDQNNAWIGLSSPSDSLLVFDVNSWVEFHQVYVTKFDFQRRCREYHYFVRFYRPRLNTALNQVNRSIRRGKVNAYISRIDSSKVFGEQIHVHFTDKDQSALNIDGTWKHKGCLIPMEVKIVLSSWGFLLPRDSYIL